MSILKKCKKLGIVFLSVLMIISGMAVFMGNSVNVSAQSDSNIISREYVDNGDYYLDIAVYEKIGKTWTIYVENNSDEDITFYYNTMMCFSGDAEKWESLRNIKVGRLLVGQGKYVTIYENWFATSVAFSWIDGDERLITYGDNLDADDLTLSVYHSKVDI